MLQLRLNALQQRQPLHFLPAFCAIYLVVCVEPKESAHRKIETNKEKRKREKTREREKEKKEKMKA